MTDAVHQDSSSGSSPRRRLVRRCVLVVLLGGVLAIIVSGWIRPAAPLPAGIDSQEWVRAEEQWRHEHGAAPDSADLLFSLARAAAEAGQFEKAMSCWEQIPVEHPRWGVRSRLMMGHHALKNDFAFLAERSLRQGIAAGLKGAVSPVELAASYNELVYLLSVELRLEERKPILEEMHRLGIADVFDSKMLYFPYLLLWHPASGRTRQARFLEKDPQSLELQIASVRYLTFDGETEEAEKILRRLRKNHPDHPGILAALLECAYEQGDSMTIAELLAEPLASSDQKGSLMLSRYRGFHAADEGRWENGLADLTDVLKHDPSDSAATMALSRIWERTGDKTKRDECLDRARRLSQIRVRLPSVNESNIDACRELVADCHRLPFPEAAAAFEQHAERIAAVRSRAPSPSRLPVQSP